MGSKTGPVSSRHKECQHDKRPLKLLTFTTLFPNRVQPNHGVFVENRLRHLIGSGKVESVVVAPVPYFPAVLQNFPEWGKFARVEQREERHGLVIHHPRYLAIPRIGMTVTPALLAARTVGFVRKIIAQGGDFDVIDAHYLYPDGIAALWIGKQIGRPVVITARGTDVNLIPRYRLPRHMIQKALGEAQGLIAVSQALKGAMVDLGAEPEGVEVLRNGVDLALFAPADRAEARGALGLCRPTLISVGHLIERKGHDRVIEAMRDLPEFELLIVGDGPERDRLNGMINVMGVRDRVRILGSIPHAELPAIYVAADALVLASSREGWANVLLEAMACGTPVVASNIWGNPEVVSAPEAGVLMNENTASGIVEAVRRLFQTLPTRVAVRHYAEGFGWKETTEGQLALFERVVREHRLRSPPAVRAE